MAEMSVAEMSIGRNVHGRNVCGRNVLAETSVAEMSVAEMSEHRPHPISAFVAEQTIPWLDPPCYEEARWPSGRAPDSGARSRGFDSQSGPRVVSLSKIHVPPKSSGNNGSVPT